nr:16S rRNA (guanine(966)-N(2))-methyltransferase RsmD [Desulfurispora thermophila]
MLLRVIAGKAKKRILKVPTGWTGRPTADRVKEALFNILGAAVIESDFLDLFAGTGNVGIEALSRGARKACFVEKDRRAVGAIKQNLALTGLSQQAEIWAGDVFKILNNLSERKINFDFIFLDPPYDKGYEEGVMELIIAGKLLRPGGLLIAEVSKRQVMPEEKNGLALWRREKYGDTVLCFYRWAGYDGEEA